MVTATDNANCGACGLACSTTCTAGECVVTLASAPMNPRALAIDANSVYWVTGAYVMKTGLGGGTPTTLAGAGDGFSLAVDSVSVYWTSGGTNSVLSVPIAGGAPVTLCPSIAQPEYGMAVNGSSVYWVAQSGMMSVPLAGGTPATIAPGSALQFTALDATYVYWATQSVVLRAPLGGGTPTTMGSGFVIRGLAVNGGNVFWSDLSAGTIMSAPLGGGSAVTLVSGRQSPGNIAIDSANIYWAEAMSPGGVLRAPLAGGVPTTIALGAPLRIAVDGTSVYWLDYSGSVMKVTPK